MQWSSFMGPFVGAVGMHRENEGRFDPAGPRDRLLARRPCRR